MISLRSSKYDTQINNTLWFISLILIIEVCSTHSSFSDKGYTHAGNLYLKQDLKIYTLSWVVKLFPGCDIKHVLKNCCECPNISILENLLSNYFKLFVVKKIDYLRNAFLIAHTYYFLYNKLKNKLRQKSVAHFQNEYARSQNFSRKWLGNVHSMENHIYLESLRCVHEYFKKSKCVSHFFQEILFPRTRRFAPEFQDPLFHEQWHLIGSQGTYDINVIDAWSSGVTGRGVTVCVIDDGLEWKHPDLIENYSSYGSYDFTENDGDPSPAKNGDKNEHGTRCAGEIAAAANSVCGVGVAHRSNISGIRILGDRMTGSMEAAAFTHALTVNDIYSCSWGPSDDGKTVDGPSYLARRALLHGVTYGRKGYGSLYVVASGNGGGNQDNCNFDGYSNSIYTITIGAVDSKGKPPYYAEECATLLAVAPSSGKDGKAIVTTDWRTSNPSGCTKGHSGTSAAAPLVAGVLALALEMQPCLSWKDVQYLLVMTSNKIDNSSSDWTRSRSGLSHSHRFGFGLIDASAMVAAAAVWESIPFGTSYRTELFTVNQAIPEESGTPLYFNRTIDESVIGRFSLRILETVQVYVSIEHERRGSLKLTFTCPSGTKSMLAEPRDKDDSQKGLKSWPFATVRCWGEEPAGTYTLAVEHTHALPLKGSLLNVQIVLHGSSMSPQEFQERRRLVKRAMNGEAIKVNRSQLCHSPELNFEAYDPLSDRALKIITITGVFFLFLAISNTFEFAFCHSKAKKEFSLRVLAVSRSMAPTTAVLPMTSLGHLEYGPESPQCDSSTTFEIHQLANKNSTTDYLSIPVSPTTSCEADVSDMSAWSDESSILTSLYTDDTQVVPKDTTDALTTDHTDIEDTCENT